MQYRIDFFRDTPPDWHLFLIISGAMREFSLVSASEGKATNADSDRILDGFSLLMFDGEGDDEDRLFSLMAV